MEHAGIAICTHNRRSDSDCRAVVSLMDKQKEVKAKLGSKPLRKLDVDKNKAIEPNEPERAVAPEDDFEIIRKVRKELAFVSDNIDPLIDGYPESVLSSLLFLLLKVMSLWLMIL